MTPERRKDTVRLHATRSMVGSQCFARIAKKLLIGSLFEKLVLGDEKRRRVVKVVAVILYKQYNENTNEKRLSSRPCIV